MLHRDHVAARGDEPRGIEVTQIAQPDRPYLGRVAGLTGETTAEWVSRARAGDDEAWAELVHHNEDDVRATAALRCYLRGGV
jgi:predicted RecB family nuclease